jgi:hypothetical protein
MIALRIPRRPTSLLSLRVQDFDDLSELATGVSHGIRLTGISGSKRDTSYITSPQPFGKPSSKRAGHHSGMTLFDVPHKATRTNLEASELLTPPV